MNGGMGREQYAAYMREHADEVDANVAEAPALSELSDEQQAAVRALGNYARLHDRRAS